ncbi:PEGA domain-containing protein [Novipirellula sp.]|uniref:PEGA domain-containing protein n=1 Tax=Novipirellula sp. TaxID=2795430 RepID=UPI003562BE65
MQTTRLSPSTPSPKATRSRDPRLHSLWIVLFAILALPSVGCVRRRMTVRTNPPGATVSVDNQVIGTSPAASSFVYYGTREFRIEKEGYKTETIRRRFNPPWYEMPGLDFISETLWPGDLRDERIIDVELVPKTLAPTGEVVDRADSLRTQSQTGMVNAPR